jgi:hypothetical protein
MAEELQRPIVDGPWGPGCLDPSTLGFWMLCGGHLGRTLREPVWRAMLMGAPPQEEAKQLGTAQDLNRDQPKPRDGVYRGPAAAKHVEVGGRIHRNSG